MIEIVIPGECVPKGRPKFTKKMVVYTPPKTKQYERKVQQVIRLARVPMQTGALRVEIDVYRVPPKSFSKKKRLEALEGRIQPSTKPDLDNYIKSVLDACNGLLFEDDNAICEIHARKLYGDTAKVVLRVEVIE